MRYIILALLVWVCYQGITHYPQAIRGDDVNTTIWKISLSGLVIGLLLLYPRKRMGT